MINEDDFKDLFEIEIPPISECKHDFRKDTSHYICINCGIVNIDRPIYIDMQYKFIEKDYHCYKRRLYFLEKLRLMCCYKSCSSNVYQTVIDTIKSYEFNDVQELKTILKNLKYTSYFKHIHNIYFDIKRIRLIPLNYDQIEFLQKKFILYEKQLVNFLINKSMISYNIIIYCMFKKYGIPYYQHILLPKNCKRLIESIDGLLKNIENY